MPAIGQTEPDPIDIAVGARIKLARAEKGITQDALANALGCSYQQVQKYEHGVNRISASMLAKVARATSTPVGFFFADFTEGVAKRKGDAIVPGDLPTQFFATDGALALASDFLNMKPGKRGRLLKVAKELVE